MMSADIRFWIAKIEPAATFHILRHTYGSALAMKGVPMGVIAAQVLRRDGRLPNDCRIAARQP
jgi:hypothetical protein